MPTEKGYDKERDKDFYQWGINKPQTKKYYPADYDISCALVYKDLSLKTQQTMTEDDFIKQCMENVAKGLANRQGQAIKAHQYSRRNPKRKGAFS